MKVFAYGVSRSRLEAAIRGARLPIRLLDNLEGADAMLTLRNYFRRKPQVLRDAEVARVGAELAAGLT